MYKNTANQKVAFYAYDTLANAPKTGDASNITAYVSIDGGAVTPLADTSASETDNTNAKGIYLFDIAAGETNGDMLVFTAKSVTADVRIDPVIVFTKLPDYTATRADYLDVLATIPNETTLVTDIVNAIVGLLGGGTGGGTVVQTVTAGSAITIERGDTLTVNVTALGSLANRTKLWFSIKASLSDTDARSLVQIEESAGLLYLNKAVAASSSDGSLVVTDATSGALTITLAADAAAILAKATTLYYDIQMLDNAGVVFTIIQGLASVNLDVTRATS